MTYLLSCFNSNGQLVIVPYDLTMDCVWVVKYNVESVELNQIHPVSYLFLLLLIRLRQYRLQ